MAYGARQLSFAQQTSYPLICLPLLLCIYYPPAIPTATMPFRDKMKRAFGRPSDVGSELALTQTTSSLKRSPKEKKTRRNSSSNVYRPGEVMPKPKYQAVYNKVHQDKLLAYNFGDAWKKRKSVQSQYSPMGSRWPSTRTSMAISRQQSYSAATTERAADAESTTITMNGDHSYLQAGNGKCFNGRSPHLRASSDKEKEGKMAQMETL